MSISQVHGSAASGLSGSLQGPLPPQHESQSPSFGGPPSDAAVLHDLSLLKAGDKNPTLQAAAAKQLIYDTMGQLNAEGQLVEMKAVTEGNIHTKADEKRLRAQLQRDGVNGPPGPVSVEVAVALAEAASQQAGLQAKQESPASGVVGSATYAQNQGNAGPTA